MSGAVSSPPRSDPASTAIAPGPPGGAQVGALERIHRNVQLRGVLVAGAELLSAPQHGSLVAFPFADDHPSTHRDRIQNPAHGGNRHLVRMVAVSLSDCAGAGDGCLLDGADEVGGYTPDRDLAAALLLNARRVPGE